MLDEAGDLPRMTGLALDAARHDRMLELTGADEASLAEIRTTLDRIAACADPDLGSALALACHRDQLTDRNTRVPADLPAVWASLGQPARAEAAARSISDPEAQSSALALVAGALARAGHHQRAEAAVARAKAAARSVTDPNALSSVLAEIAVALAQLGQDQQARATVAQAAAAAQSISSSPWQPHALAEVAEALVRVGDAAAAACVAGRWTDAVRPVLLLDPSAYPALVRTLAGAFAEEGGVPAAED